MSTLPKFGEDKGRTMKRSLFAGVVALCISCIAFAQPAPAPTSYTLSTVAGSQPVVEGSQSNLIYLNLPDAVITDSAGNMYIADTQNHRVRKITPSGAVSTVAGTGAVGSGGDGGQGA